MLKFILLGVVAVIVVIAVIAALQPSNFVVSRSATIAAPPSAVFTQVNEVRNWEAWSPWAKIDPAMKQTYEGPAAGVGAISAWSGNNEVGEGRSTIIESRQNELVKFKLEFMKPFKATNAVEFVFKPEGDRTTVTWSMSGERNFFFKLMGLFMDCDKMCGDAFVQGLSQIKAITEKQPVPAT